MPRLEALDCRDGHGKACRSRPWHIWATVFCTCDCHLPLIPWAHRRWAVAYVASPDQPVPSANARARYFTYKGARRVASSWNRHNHGPGVFEVFGPAGKGED